MKTISKYIKKWRKKDFVLCMILAMVVLIVMGICYRSYASGYTTIQSRWGNLLKENTGFEFYGKSNRTGMWTYDAVIDGVSSPVLCLEPSKKMANGTWASVETVKINAQNFPYQVTSDFSITLEQAEALYYVQRQGHMADEYLTETGLNDQAMRIVVQSAVWAIMSGQWDGIENFVESLDPIIANLKDPALASNIRSYAGFLLSAQEYSNQNTIPSFAQRYKEDADNSTGNEMKLVEGVYQVTLPLDNAMWSQTELIWDIPNGWEYFYNTDKSEITFICKNGNPKETIKGHFLQGSTAALYWYQPSELKIINTGLLSHQVMIATAGKASTWEVFVKFVGGSTPTTPTGGNFVIDVKRYEHSEDFESDYSMTLEKKDDETGQLLEGSIFEVWEAFDKAQLSGSLLDKSQLGIWDGWKVCGQEVTDSKGYFLHTDRKTYLYEKRYCGGHPEPVIEYYEYSGEEDDEQTYVDELNRQLFDDAWEAWWAEVRHCEEMLASGEMHFHSVTEGEAQKQLEVDRDKAYQQFINLEYLYTTKEVTARSGYVLHGLHNDDEPIEIVAFSSSQAGGASSIVGYHTGDLDAVSEPIIKVEPVSSAQEPIDSGLKPINQEKERTKHQRFVAVGDEVYEVDEEGERLP